MARRPSTSTVSGTTTRTRSAPCSPPWSEPRPRYEVCGEGLPQRGRGGCRPVSVAFGGVGHVVLLQSSQLVVIEPQVDRGDGIGQVAESGDPDDRCGDGRLVEQPGERDLRAGDGRGPAGSTAAPRRPGRGRTGASPARPRA